MPQLPYGTGTAGPVAEQPVPLLLQRLDMLTQRRQMLEQDAHELLAHWRSAFPPGRMPFYLARLTGESLTLLRWRRAASTPGVGGRRFELLESAETVVRDQQPGARKALFEFERRRMTINYDYALSVYEHGRLTELLRQRRRLAEARKLLGA
ncbi:MAG: hypothetical protein ACT4PZ_20355 [Panacagrimonas sp.]